MDWKVGCGTATCKYMNDSQYEGEWVNFKRHGKGKFTSADGSVYEGDWVNDKREGLGQQLSADGTFYDGSWASDLKHGYGSCLLADGTTELEGYWDRDQFTGNASKS